MSITTKVAGAAWAQVKASSLVPDRRFLMAEHVFGGTLAESVYNRAEPSRPLTVVGNPAIGATAATVKSGPGGYGFEAAGYLPSSDRTLIVVRRNPAPGGGVTSVIGQQNGVSTVNDISWAIRHFGANTYAGNGEALSGDFGAGARRATPTTPDFYFEAAVARPGSFGLLYYWQAGAQQVATSVVLSDAPRFGTNVQFVTSTVIGTAGLGDTNPNNTSDVAYFIEFNRPLDADEIAAVYANVVAHGARRGLAIG